MRYRRSPDVGFEVVDGHISLSPPDVNDVVRLNQVGTLVWAAIDPPRSATEVAALLYPALEGIGIDELTVDVAEFLSDLATVGWVEQTRNGAVT